MTPGKTPFDRAVHTQQTSACIQRQVQALRALRSAPVLPRLGCRRGGKRSFEKPILANFFRVKLGGADLTGADVTEADFTEADLSGTIFRGVKGFDKAKGLDRAENFDKIVR
jgi:hypothetical protein